MKKRHVEYQCTVRGSPTYSWFGCTSSKYGDRYAYVHYCITGGWFIRHGHVYTGWYCYPPRVQL